MDEKPRVIEFDQLCRFCMRSSDDMQSIFGHPQDIPDLVRSLSRIEIHENDKFPKKMCSECITYAGKIAEFKELCIQTDRTLREYFSGATEDDYKLNTVKQEPELMCEDVEIIPPGSDLEGLSNSRLSPELIKREMNDATSENAYEVGYVSEAAEENDSDTTDEERERKTQSTVSDDTDDEPMITETTRCTTTECLLCGEKFSNKTFLKYHLKCDHADEKTPIENKIRLCFYCPKAYSNFEYLKIHLNFHRRDIWICPTCGKKIGKKEKFIDHLRMHANERHYKCDICGKDFTCHKYIAKHKRIHERRDESSNCPICNEAFERVMYVKIHLESEHIPLDDSSPKVHRCVTCMKNYMTFEHLMIHMKLHPVKIWSCPVCEKQFRRVDKYRNHVKTHQNDRTYRCVYCCEEFRTKYQLNQHLQTHAKETVQKPVEALDQNRCGGACILRKHTSIVEREFIVAHHKEGKTLQEIAFMVKRPKSTVQYIVRRFVEHKRIIDAPRNLNRKKLTLQDERFVMRKIRKNPKTSAVDITKELNQNNKVKVCPETVRNVLRKIRLKRSSVEEKTIHQSEKHEASKRLCQTA